MNKAIVIFTILFAALLVGHGDETKAELYLIVKLSDTSTVIGKSDLKQIRVKSVVGEFDVAMDGIRSINFGMGGVGERITFANGDTVTGTWEIEAIALDTLFGKVTVKREHIRSVHVSDTGEWRSNSYLNGNTLIATGYANKVIELDPAGNVVWEFEAKGPWSAEKLSNGNVLVATYNSSRVMEVNVAGKVVWEYPINALNAKPLANGNVLIAAYSGSKAIEVNRAKEVVWSYTTPGNCFDVQRLSDGNTMICTTSVIQEVSPEGDTVWEHRPKGSKMYGVQRLENGNTLIADINSGVIEISPDKKIVWEYGAQQAADAYRLPNGNTLITGPERAIEVTPDKNIVWTRDGFKRGTVRR